MNRLFHRFSTRQQVVLALFLVLPFLGLAFGVAPEADAVVCPYKSWTTCGNIFQSGCCNGLWPRYVQNCDIYERDLNYKFPDCRYKITATYTIQYCGWGYTCELY